MRYNERLPPKTLRRVVSESPPFCITRRCAFRGSCIESSKSAALRRRGWSGVNTDGARRVVLFNCEL